MPVEGVRRGDPGEGIGLGAELAGRRGQSVCASRALEGHGPTEVWGRPRRRGRLVLETPPKVYYRLARGSAVLGGPKGPPEEARVVLVGGLQWKTERERHAYMAWPRRACTL